MKKIAINLIIVSVIKLIGDYTLRRIDTPNNGYSRSNRNNNHQSGRNNNANQTRSERQYNTSNSRKPSKQKNTRPIMVVAIILFIIAMATFVFTLFNTYASKLLPQKYILILFVIAIILCCTQIIILYTRRDKIGNKVVSLILSALMILSSFYILGLVNSANNMIETIEENVEEAGVVISDTGESIETEVVYDQVEDISEDPFLIYLSGLDDSGISKKDGSVRDKGRSDVNIIAAVNPNSKKILMVTIPRDTYVGINGDEGKMDKLTHCGNWGVYCSMKTIEELFDNNIKLNYYAKVNFNSLVNIVDALGGITIDSPSSFTSGSSLTGKSYSFNKGENTVMGDQALAFARERHNLSDGDNQRGRDHEIIIKAIIDKATSPEVLTPGTLNTVMDVFANNISTSLSSDEMRNLIQTSLDDPAWDVNMMEITGKGTSKTTYTAHTNRYVYIPDENSIKEAGNALNAVLNS